MPKQTKSSKHRIISVSQVGRQLRELAHWARDRQGRAIIRTNGKRVAVLISYREYEEMQRLRTQASKSELLEKLKTLRSTA